MADWESALGEFRQLGRSEIELKLPIAAGRRAGTGKLAHGTPANGCAKGFRLNIAYLFSRQPMLFPRLRRQLIPCVLMSVGLSLA